MEDVGDTQLPNMMFLTKVFSGLTALTSSPCWMKKMTLGHFPMSSHTPQCQVIHPNVKRTAKQTF